MTRQMLSTVSKGSRPAMARGQRAHHRRLAAGAEGGARRLRLLDGDQRVDDLAALHQEPVHRLVDAVDLAAQVRERDAVVGASAMAVPVVVQKARSHSG